MIKKLTLVLLAAGVLSSCSMAPNYVRPDAPIESQFPGNADDASAKTPVTQIGWNEFFHEPRLKALIAAAIENNRDLRVAALRIEEARALYGIQWADRLPNFEAQGAGTRQRTVGTTGGMVTQGNYTVGLGLAAFELDFFGRVKSLSDAALAEHLATEEAQRAGYISLVSELAKPI